MQEALNQKTEDRISALEKGQKDIIDLLKPIAETYTTVSTLAKWFMALAVFISITIGIIIGWKDILHK